MADWGPVTDSTGENEVAPEDPTDPKGGEVPNASPPSADDHVAGPEGGSDAPLPPPTGVDHTVELKAAGVKTPDISDVFTPPDGDEIPDPPTPPRPPERPQRPGNEAEAKASSDSEILPPPSIRDAGQPNTSEGFAPNKTSALPA
ncbi:MAG: hypothetical protein GY773_23465, partial [Actinomycetia bacterium]|nr:hypothetical protein [Actinomycetes bacterium]